MIAFISYFFPAIFTLGLYESLTKNSLSWKQVIIKYCSYVMFINLGCFSIKKFFLHTADSPMLYEGDMLPRVAFNYIIMSLCMAVIILFIEILFSKNIKVTIEEECCDKE